MKKTFPDFEIRFLSENILVDEIKRSLTISQVGKESDIIKLNFSSANQKVFGKFLK